MSDNEIKELKEVIEDLEEELETVKQLLTETVDEVESMESDSRDYEDAVLEHEGVAEKAFNSGYRSGCVNGFISEDNNPLKSWLNYKIEAKL